MKVPIANGFPTTKTKLKRVVPKPIKPVAQPVQRLSQIVPQSAVGRLKLA